MNRTVRVAAAQCEIRDDVAANRATLVDMVRRAAEQGAQLVVLPEFGNHYSIYESEEHAWEVATDTTDPDDPFVRALSAAAGDHGIWVVANSTVRRDGEGDRPGQRRITVTQLLFSPEAGLVGEGDKQVLMGAERTFLSGGDAPGCVMDTPLGRIGLYCCMDGVISEPARSLAVRGAEILCNSLNSFALDEASLHVPARAAENGVWVVACCKVGPLIPDDRRQEIASAVGLPESTFTAAGESQIVSPTGAVVAKAPRDGAAVVLAEIDLDEARGAHRPDGTSLLGLRRPELYLPVAQDVRPLPPTGAEPFGAAVISEGCGEPDRLAERVRQLGSGGARLIVLPELAASDRGTLEGDPESAARAGTHLLGVLRTALAGTDSLVVTSVVEEHADGGYSHVGLAVSAEGVALHQPALHVPERHRSWQTDLGERIKVVTTGFGRLALLVGDDLLVPEAARLAVLGGAEVVASPFSVATSYDLALIAPQRCAENRMCLAVASRHGHFGGSAFFEPPRNPVWSRADRPEPFDQTINDPERRIAGPGDPYLTTTLHPGRTVEKLVSTDTDLVWGRRPELRTDLVSPVS